MTYLSKTTRNAYRRSRCDRCGVEYTYRIYMTSSPTPECSTKILTLPRPRLAACSSPSASPPTRGP